MRPKEMSMQQTKAVCAGKRHRGTHRVHCISKSASQENTHSMQKRESWKRIPSAQREISDEGFLTSETYFTVAGPQRHCQTKINYTRCLVMHKKIMFWTIMNSSVDGNDQL